MFTICTGFIQDGKIEEYMNMLKDDGKIFNNDIGVLNRKFFQCEYQSHIIWSITEWVSEKHHNDAAESLMKIRRDDRFASISGGQPYFEIFCQEDETIKSQGYAQELNYMVIAHFTINETCKEKYLEIRDSRINEFKDQLKFMRVFYNIYNSNEFVAFLGFKDKEEYEASRNIGGLFIEEYLFTGLKDPFEMSYVAGYNQFICNRLNFKK